MISGFYLLIKYEELLLLNGGKNLLVINIGSIIYFYCNNYIINKNKIFILD